MAHVTCHDILGNNSPIKYVEEFVLRTMQLKPSRVRNMEDTFILWSHQEDVRVLLDDVNSIYKKETDKFAFFDVLITYSEQGFRTSLYCNQYSLDWTISEFQFIFPNHLYSVKKGTVYCLQNWITFISGDLVSCHKEMISIKNTLLSKQEKIIL